MIINYFYWFNRRCLLILSLCSLSLIIHGVAQAINKDEIASASSAATRAVVFDFDGDQRADISVFRPSSGVWYGINSANNSFFAAQFGVSTDEIATADYDGDSKTDIAVYRQTSTNPYLSYFYILNSSNGTVRTEQFGKIGDSPFPGDWDGDGKADVAVYTQLLGIPENPPPPGFFSYRPSSNPSADTVTIAVNPGGVPVPADYDGDGRQDAAVFIQRSGVWLIKQSSDNAVRTVQFGLSSDKPVPADYDGDGKTDIAVFRSGTWYILNNGNRFTGVQFGFATDKPVPADYDGDGRADIAVYRDGIWFLLRSTAGFAAVQFGLPTDVPVPAVYLWQY